MRIVFLWGCLMGLCLTNISAQPYFSKQYDLNTYTESGSQLVYVNADKTIILSRAFCHNDTRYCTELICVNDQGEINWITLLDSVSYVHRQSITANEYYIYLGGHNNLADLPSATVFQFNWNGELVKSVDLNEEYPVASINSINQIDSNIVLTLNKRGDEGVDYLVPDTVYFHFMDQELNYQRHFSYTSGIYAYESGASLTKAQDGSGYYCELFGDIFTGQLRDRQLTLLKFDLEGNLLWTYPTPADFIISLPDLVATPDGGAAMIWTVDNFTLEEVTNVRPTKLYKISSEGELEWEKLVVSPGAYWEEYGTALILAQNGDFVVIGEEYGDAVHGEIDLVNAGWLARISPSGELKWARNIYDNRIGPPIGSRFGMAFYHGTELPNGDLMLVGIADDAAPPDSDRLINSNTWLVRTDSMGCVHPGCDRLDLITSVWKVPAKNELDVRCFPNPVRNELTVELTGEVSLGKTRLLQIHNSLGIPAGNYHLNQSKTTLFLEHLPSGVYYLSLQEAGELLFRQAILKI